MGYSYGQNERGSWVLSCDNCGNVGGVRKRTCPYTVLGDTLRTAKRYEMSYCYPPALCAVCYAALGGLRGVHGQDCETGAAKSQAGYDAIEAGLDAGELYVVSASMSGPGMVTVTFWGRRDPATRERREVKRVMPEGDYHPGAKPRLSDYELETVAV